MLKVMFELILEQHKCGSSQFDAMWAEIENQYSAHSRHYHTLAHLDNLILHLQEVQPVIQHWDAVVLAVAYHDIIYNPLRSNNEERSAAVAMERLSAAGVDADTLARTHRHIIASKTHIVSADQDTNYFTDADLSVLGASREVYKLYADHVRKEYRYYPDLVYKPGRTKVLRHFLEMPRIFKTDHFYNTFEQQARHNLLWELDGN